MSSKLEQAIAEWRLHNEATLRKSGYWRPLSPVVIPWPSHVMFPRHAVVSPEQIKYDMAQRYERGTKGEREVMASAFAQSDAFRLGRTYGGALFLPLGRGMVLKVTAKSREPLGIQTLRDQKSDGHYGARGKVQVGDDLYYASTGRNVLFRHQGALYEVPVLVLDKKVTAKRGSK